MPSLILLRHGESAGNADKILAGRLDVDLSERGIEQAKHAAHLLKGYLKKGNYSLMTSPLQRARKTARIVVERCGSPYIYSWISALSEKNFGDFQGKSYAELAPYKNEPWFGDMDAALPGGESCHDIEKRVLPYYKGLARWRLSQNDNVLIVAHQHSLLAIIREVEQNRNYVKLGNAVPRVYDLNEKLNLISVKDLQ